MTIAKFVSRLAADLQQAGIKPWIDQTGITPGTMDWEDALREAIRNSQAVLLIASPHSRKSRYVKDELRIAEYYQLPIFPIWAEGQEYIDSIPLGLGGTQYIDARAEAYAAALLEMVASLGEGGGVNRSMSWSATGEPAPLLSRATPTRACAPFARRTAGISLGAAHW